MIRCVERYPRHTEPRGRALIASVCVGWYVTRPGVADDPQLIRLRKYSAHSMARHGRDIRRYAGRRPHYPDIRSDRAFSAILRALKAPAPSGSSSCTGAMGSHLPPADTRYCLPASAVHWRDDLIASFAPRSRTTRRWHAKGRQSSHAVAEPSDAAHSRPYILGAVEQRDRQRHARRDGRQALC
jgi:hypothetical protein